MEVVNGPLRSGQAFPSTFMGSIITSLTKTGTTFTVDQVRISKKTKTRGTFGLKVLRRLFLTKGSPWLHFFVHVAMRMRSECNATLVICCS